MVRRRWAPKGSTLVPVMAIVAAVLLVGVAIFILGHSEGDIVEYAVDDSRAFYIAEGGLERAMAYLAALELEDPSAIPPEDLFTDEPLGGGKYTVTVTDTVIGGSGLDAYEIISTGEKDTVLRQVKVTVIAETFAMYSWLIESIGGGYSVFRSGEYFGGPVHVNGDMHIQGDPTFAGRVTVGGSVKPELNDANFMMGYEEGVDPVDLPTQDDVFATLREAAGEPGGLVLPLLGDKMYYEVALGDPDLGQLTYQGYNEDGSTSGPEVVVDISGLNGAVWCENDIYLSGTLDGQLTIGVDGTIHITDDILYAASTPGSGPDPDCDDMLGLIAAGHPKGDIIIDYTTPNEDDCEVHAVMMALQKTVEAEDYMHHLRGDFIIYGGILADYAVHLAQYDGSVVISGYARDYHFDARVGLLPPPFFPHTGNFSVVTWEEVVPVVES